MRHGCEETEPCDGPMIWQKSTACAYRQQHGLYLLSRDGSTLVRPSKHDLLRWIALRPLPIFSRLDFNNDGKIDESDLEVLMRDAYGQSQCHRVC